MGWPTVGEVMTVMGDGPHPFARLGNVYVPRHREAHTGNLDPLHWTLISVERGQAAWVAEALREYAARYGAPWNVEPTQVQRGAGVTARERYERRVREIVVLAMIRDHFGDHGAFAVRAAPAAQAIDLGDGRRITSAWVNWRRVPLGGVVTSDASGTWVRISFDDAPPGGEP